MTATATAARLGAVGATTLPSLTGLRWAAAFLVFGYHLAIVEFFGPGPGQRFLEAAFAAGHTGVSFFFLLSGFVLMWSSPAPAPARFWRRRFARVYPLHAVTALLALAVLLWHARHELPAPGPAVANLTLTQAWVPDVAYYQSLNTVSWTLSCEAFFYLAFPFFAGAAARLRLRGAAILAGVALAATVLGPLAGGSWAFHFLPLARFPEFVLGVALACLVRLTHTRLGTYARALWIAAGVLTTAGYLAAAHAPGALRYAAATALGFALVLVAAAVSDLRGSRPVWQRPALVRLGELSFAFYLVHLLVIRVAEAVVGYHPRLGHPSAAALTALTLAVSLLVSWLLHETVEKPSRRLLLRRG